MLYKRARHMKNIPWSFVPLYKTHYFAVFFCLTTNTLQMASSKDGLDVAAAILPFFSTPIVLLETAKALNLLLFTSALL